MQFLIIDVKYSISWYRTHLDMTAFFLPSLNISILLYKLKHNSNIGITNKANKT